VLNFTDFTVAGSDHKVLVINSWSIDLQFVCQEESPVLLKCVIKAVLLMAHAQPPFIVIKTFTMCSLLTFFFSVVCKCKVAGDLSVSLMSQIIWWYIADSSSICLFASF
jgi:hypothetical protein